MSTFPAVDESAPCTQVSPELFFPSKETSGRRLTEAKAACNSGNAGAPCPFRDACLSYGLRHKVEGIWGGHTDREREELRKAHGIKAEAISLTGLVLQGMNSAKVQHGTSVGVEHHRKRYDALCDPCQGFVDRRRGKVPASPCPDCGTKLLPQSLRKHRRTACPARLEVAS